MTHKDREAELDQYWRQEAGTSRSPRQSTPEWKQALRKTPNILQVEISTIINGKRTRHQGASSQDDKLRQGTGNPSELAAFPRHEGVVSHIQVKRRMKLEILFDLIAADVCQASVVICTVTQDVDLGRFDGAAFTDDIAGESTGETLQLLLPWDVWEICQFQIVQHQKDTFFFMEIILLRFGPVVI